MSDREWNPADLFDLIGDPVARRTLVLASEGPISANGLADALDVSPPTIYRRVNALREYDLLAERVHFDEDRNQYKTFTTTLKQIAFEIDSGSYRTDMTFQRNPVDQFETFWDEFDDSSPDIELNATDRSVQDNPKADGSNG